MPALNSGELVGTDWYTRNSSAGSIIHSPLAPFAALNRPDLIAFRMPAFVRPTRSAACFAVSMPKVGGVSWRGKSRTRLVWTVSGGSPMVPHAGMHLVGGVGAPVYGRYTGGRHHPAVRFEAAGGFIFEAALSKVSRKLMPGGTFERRRLSPTRSMLRMLSATSCAEWLVSAGVHRGITASR